MTEKDIYSNGVALLEEWEDVNYCEHSFKFKEEWLTDEEVVDLLNEQHETIQLLKKEIERLKGRYYYENNQDNPRVNVEDIIGLIHTDEPTNSVELKKELYK